MRQFKCLTCYSKFKTNSTKSVCRCPDCGSLKTEEILANKVSKEKSNQPTTILPKRNPNKITYLCIDCTKKFEFPKEKSASCPKCSSTDVKEIFPEVKIVTQEYIPTPSKKEVKKIRYIRRQWKNYLAFSSHYQSLIALSQRAGLREEKQKKLVQLMDECLKSLEESHDTKLKEYNNGISR